MPYSPLHRRMKQKNIGLFCALVVLAAVFFGITLIKIS